MEKIVDTQLNAKQRSCATDWAVAIVASLVSGTIAALIVHAMTTDLVAYWTIPNMYVIPAMGEENAELTELTTQQNTQMPCQKDAIPSHIWEFEPGEQNCSVWTISSAN